MRFPPIVRAAALLCAALVVSRLAGCAESGAQREAVSYGLPPAAAAVRPPVAQKRPHVSTLHGDRRSDDYFWLRDRNDPATIAYLEAENAYTKAALAHTEGLQETLYGEMLGRIKQDDSTPPTRRGDYWYYTRTVEGRPYSVYCRRKGSPTGPEEVLLDGNALGEGKPYFRVGVFDVSPDHTMLAYSVDGTGAERYTMFFKDLRTGKTLEQTIPDTYYSSAWAMDNRTFFYVTVDAASRPEKLWRYTVGSDPSTAAVAHHEKDEKYFLSVGRTRSDRFIVCALASTNTSEARAIPADRPGAEFSPVVPRRQDVEYSVDHRGDQWVIVTNEGAVNFKVMAAPVATSADRATWKTVIPHRDDATVTGVDLFARQMVVSERVGGLPTLRVRTLAGAGLEGPDHTIAMPEPAYVASPGANPEFDTAVYRFNYSSLVTPGSVFDYDLASRTRTLVKEQPVLGGYDRTKYASERVWAPTRDGKRIPVSLVYRKGTPRDGSAPCLLNGYGSYGISYDPSFSSNNLSLLDRGFVVAIAHIRGGAEMGRGWYEDGRLRNKKNTFNDFVDAADHLVKERYTSPDRLAAIGGSAGGLLMGAVTNMRPDLFRVVVAAVPFVDVINTMIDETIPLTVNEWEQWGNPVTSEGDYRYMLSYSPYDNVAPKRYPNMLVLAGLNDPRVAYWEPAKWTAKLRALKTDDNLLVLRTNMGAGHGGASGRFERLREVALQDAFIIDRLGVSDGARTASAR